MTAINQRRGVRRTGITLGPFGERVTDPATGRVRCRLTAEGVERLERWLVKYPAPEALLWKFHPAVGRRAREFGATNAEIAATARYGVVLAMLQFDPDRVPYFEPFARKCIRSAIQKEYQKLVYWAERYGRRGRESATGLAGLRDREMDWTRSVPARKHEFASWVDVTRLRALVAELIAARVESRRDREVVALVYGLDNGHGVRRATVAAALGLTAAEVTAIEERVVDLILPELERQVG